MSAASASKTQPSALKTGVPDGPKTFRPGDEMSANIEKLARRAGVPKALIVRRCIEFALPKLASGEVPIVTVAELPPEEQPELINPYRG